MELDSRPKEVVTGHHNTLEVMSCAQKPSATQLGPSKQARSYVFL